MTRLLRFVLCLMLLCGGADAQIVGAFVQGGGSALPSYVSPLLFTTRTTTVGAGGTVFLVDGSNGAFEIAAAGLSVPAYGSASPTQRATYMFITDNTGHYSTGAVGNEIE